MKTFSVFFAVPVLMLALGNAQAADRTVQAKATPEPATISGKSVKPVMTKGRAPAVQSVSGAVNRMKQSDIESAQSSRVKGNSQSSAPTGNKGAASMGRGYGPGVAPNDTKGKFGNSSLPGRPGQQANSGKAPSGFGNHGFGGGPQSSGGRDPGQAFRSPQGFSSGGSSGSRPGTGNKMRPGAYGGDPRLRDDAGDMNDAWDSASKSKGSAPDESAVDKAAKAALANQQAQKAKQAADDLHKEAIKPVRSRQTQVKSSYDSGNWIGSGQGFGDGSGGKGPSGTRPDLSSAGKKPNRPGVPNGPVMSSASRGLVSGDGHGREGSKGFSVVKPTGIQVSPKTDLLINPGSQAGE